MDKQGIYHFLMKKKIWYEITEHNEIHTMKEAESITLPYPDDVVKNLFVRDGKNYYLISVKKDKNVDLKQFRKMNQTGRLTFASSQELSDVLKLELGSVTPLGLLNDDQLKVSYFMDKEIYDTQQIIGVHPNDNSATVWLKVHDLLNIVREHGNSVVINEIKERKDEEDCTC